MIGNADDAPAEKRAAVRARRTLSPKTRAARGSSYGCSREVDGALRRRSGFEHPHHRPDRAHDDSEFPGVIGHDVHSGEGVRCNVLQRWVCQPDRFEWWHRVGRILRMSRDRAWRPPIRLVRRTRPTSGLFSCALSTVVAREYLTARERRIGCSLRNFSVGVEVLSARASQAQVSTPPR